MLGMMSAFAVIGWRIGGNLKATRKHSRITLAVLVLGVTAAAPARAQDPVDSQLQSPFYSAIGTTGSIQDFFQAAAQTTFAADLSFYTADYTFPDLHGNNCLSLHHPNPNCPLGIVGVTTPEPSAMVLLASGLMGLAGAGILRRRRRV
jgi:hypothetical protein